MNANEQRIARESIQRIYHIWFEPNTIEEPIEKITALFQLLVLLAPYQCCLHPYKLWSAYLAAKEMRLWYLARHRLRVFEAGLKGLQQLASSFPVRG